MKKRFKTKTEEITMELDGVLIATKVQQRKVVDNEPYFMKVYFNDIISLFDLPRRQGRLLGAILKRMDYQNKIILIKSVKAAIAAEINTVEGTVGNDIKMLCDKKILSRADRSVYIGNPHYFGKGTWSDISKIEFNKTYSNEQITTDVNITKESSK